MRTQAWIGCRECGQPLEPGDERGDVCSPCRHGETRIPSKRLLRMRPFQERDFPEEASCGGVGFAAYPFEPHQQQQHQDQHQTAS